MCSHPIDSLVRQIDTIYESINIHHGLVVFDDVKQHTDAKMLFDILERKDFPVFMYTDTSVIDVTRYRLFFVPRSLFPFFSMTWAQYFKLTNFMVALGLDVIHDIKCMSKKFTLPEYRVLISA